MRAAEHETGSKGESSGARLLIKDIGEPLDRPALILDPGGESFRHAKGQSGRENPDRFISAAEVTHKRPLPACFPCDGLDLFFRLLFHPLEDKPDGLAQKGQSGKRAEAAEEGTHSIAVGIQEPNRTGLAIFRRGEPHRLSEILDDVLERVAFNFFLADIPALLASLADVAQLIFSVESSRLRPLLAIPAGNATLLVATNGISPAGLGILFLADLIPKSGENSPGAGDKESPLSGLLSSTESDKVLRTDRKKTGGDFQSAVGLLSVPLLNVLTDALSPSGRDEEQALSTAGEENPSLVRLADAGVELAKEGRGPGDDGRAARLEDVGRDPVRIEEDELERALRSEEAESRLADLFPAALSESHGVEEVVGNSLSWRTAGHSLLQGRTGDLADCVPVVRQV
ncbi:MAG TPA: hypothetical protein VJ725_24310 [Thermoanaerobaculia bacterium]|nr:hypothetical protein [Thermoanaerobaculia bacterium]